MFNFNDLFKGLLFIVGFLFAVFALLYAALEFILPVLGVPFTALIVVAIIAIFFSVLIIQDRGHP